MKKANIFLFVMKLGSTYDNDKSCVETGIELKEATIEQVKNFIFPYGFFFGDVEEKFDCIFKYPNLNSNEIVFEVQNLDSKYYTEILFAVKQKLETTFETAGLYMKALQEL